MHCPHPPDYYDCQFDQHFSFKDVGGAAAKTLQSEFAIAITIAKSATISIVKRPLDWQLPRSVTVNRTPCLKVLKFDIKYLEELNDRVIGCIAFEE